MFPVLISLIFGSFLGPFSKAVIGKRATRVFFRFFLAGLSSPAISSDDVAVERNVRKKVFSSLNSSIDNE